MNVEVTNLFASLRYSFVETKRGQGPRFHERVLVIIVVTVVIITMFVIIVVIVIIIVVVIVVVVVLPVPWCPLPPLSGDPGHVRAGGRAGPRAALATEARAPGAVR